MKHERLPQLLYTREPREEFIVAVVVPAVFGIVTGLALGISEGAYLLLSLLGILGGFVAGAEHDVPLEGLYRGLLGGLLFGAFILIAHGVFHDAEPEAELPDPEAALILITAGFGMGLGYLGARWRAKRSFA